MKARVEWVEKRTFLGESGTGHGLSRDKAARAISLSAKKYCSVSAMLGHTAKITHDFEIVDKCA